MQFLLITRTRIYKRFIDRQPRNNRFSIPGCSSYGLETFQFHGAVKDSYPTLIRLLKCHLFHDGGINLFQNNLVDNNG